MHGQQNVKKMPVFFSNTVFVYYLFLSFHYYVFTDRVLILAKVCNYCSRAYWCLVVRPQVTKTISDCVLLVYRLIPNSTSRTLQSLLAKKSHDSKFNTAIINGRIITFRNDTINLIFLYTKTCVSQVHLFSPSALFTCDHNRLSNLQIDVYCCNVSPFGNHLAFYQHAVPPPPSVLKLGTRKFVSNLLKFISRKPGRRKSSCCRK